jgi:hypothetical protein
MKRLRAADRGPKRKPAHRPLHLETLEDRCVPSVNSFGENPLLGDGAADTATLPAITSSSDGASTGPTDANLPGAKAAQDLNLQGDTVSSQLGYSNIVTPVFDTDGDPASFAAGDLTAVYQTWQGVAANHAPLTIQVTTAAPRILFGNTGSESRTDSGGNGNQAGATTKAAVTVPAAPSNLAAPRFASFSSAAPGSLQRVTSSPPSTELGPDRTAPQARSTGQSAPLLVHPFGKKWKFQPSGAQAGWQTGKAM